MGCIWNMNMDLDHSELSLIRSIQDHVFKLNLHEKGLNDVLESKSA